jgi:multidrug resistance protein
MLAPGIAQLMKDFHTTNDEVASLSVTIYLLGFACGPLILAPLSELYGRLPCYHVCNALWIIFTVACAVATNMPSFIVFRFLAGAAGSCPLTIGGGTVVDVIPQESRGTAMSVFATGPLLGPVIGPVIGGFLAEAEGWRWVFWLLAIAVRHLRVNFLLSQG